MKWKSTIAHLKVGVPYFDTNFQPPSQIFNEIHKYSKAKHTFFSQIIKIPYLPDILYTDTLQLMKLCHTNLWVLQTSIK